MGADFDDDVFLSHSAKDKAVVRPLAERLRRDGLKVWFDEWVLKPGDSIPAKIEGGLEHSRVLVLCMPANAFGSDWAQLEVGTYGRGKLPFRDPLNQERRFIPLQLDGGQVEIAAELVHELDADGKQLRVVKLTDYTGEKVRSLFARPEDLRARWADAGQRADVIQQLAERGIDFPTVAAQAGKPEADPFDLLCHLAFNAPVLTRRQRADRLKQQHVAFFKFFAPEAREILDDLLEKYASDGELQFTLPDVLKVRPISDHGNVNEIIGKFGGADQLRTSVNQLQSLLYAA